MYLMTAYLAIGGGGGTWHGVGTHGHGGCNLTETLNNLSGSVMSLVLLILSARSVPQTSQGTASACS